MTAPSVGVIVLNWNGREHLTDCLTSLRRQSYSGPSQIILVDNGSDDGSAAFVEATYPEVRVIRSNSNVGFSAGNNLGARQLDTDLLAFVNNDTRADSRWLEELVEAVTSAPDVAAAGGRILSWDGTRVDFAGGGATLTGLGLQFGFGEPAGVGAPAGDTLFACGGSMIVNRKRYWEVGGLDDDYFLFYEDVDLGWRFWLAGYRVVYQPGSVIYHRHHGSTRRLEDRKLAVLYERNALYTIYKNYDDRHLAAVLPAAMLLCAERATMIAAVDRSDFGLPTGQKAARTIQRKSADGDWATLHRSIAERGLRSTGQRLVRAARSRGRARLGRLRTRLARQVGGQGPGIAMPTTAVSRLLALEQFGANLPMLRAKREAVQRLRRRADQEILELFKTPLDPGFDGPGFREYHQQVLRSLGLDRWVEEKESRPRPVSHA